MSHTKKQWKIALKITAPTKSTFECTGYIGETAKAVIIKALDNDFQDIAKQRDELLAALEGLHKVCEIALAGKDGNQHAYFETRAGHFVDATKAMEAAESAVASMKDGAA